MLSIIDGQSYWTVRSGGTCIKWCYIK